MRVRFPSIGRMFAVLVLTTLSLSYVHADNILSGSGTLGTVFFFNSGGSINNCYYCGGIQNFGSNSLSGSIYFLDSFSSYSESPLPSGLTGVSATVGSGSIRIILGYDYEFYGQISSGSLSGYYCASPYCGCACQHMNGEVETTVYFSGEWVVNHFPPPPLPPWQERWPAQGHFYIEEIHDHGLWLNVNNWYQSPSMIWIETQMPGSTPEPDTLLLLGSGVLGLAVVIRRRLSA